MYYAALRSAEVELQNARASIDEISDLYTRTMAKNADFPISFSKNANLWTLLCICSQQTSFLKTQLKWYAAPKAAFERGHAIEGEWREAEGWPLEVAMGAYLFSNRKPRPGISGATGRLSE